LSASGPLTALVLTTSDRSAVGEREDTSGIALEERLRGLGFEVERLVVADDQPEIEAALVDATTRHPFIVTTGGTGLTLRDVTPQATAAVADYLVPGLGEQMRAAGRRITPMADLSRAIAAVRGGSLIVNVPGSPKAALESLEAIEPLLGHALETLAGPFDHAVAARAGRSDLPDPAGAPGSAGSHANTGSRAASHPHSHSDGH
jgi:molybdopterin adenylyltransferase